MFFWLHQQNAFLFFLCDKLFPVMEKGCMAAVHLCPLPEPSCLCCPCMDSSGRKWGSRVPVWVPCVPCKAETKLVCDFNPRVRFILPLTCSSPTRAEIITRFYLSRAPPMERWFANHILRHQRIYPPFSATCMQGKRSDLHSPPPFFFWNGSCKLPSKVQEINANDRLILWVWILSCFQGWIWIFFFWSRAGG